VKKEERSFLLFLNDMLDSMQAIEQYIEGVDLAIFLNDRMRRDAVVRNLEVIGEAAHDLPDNLKELYPNVPWEQMYRMRNIAAHQYFMVDYEIVWKIITEYLPQDKEAVIQIIQSLSNEYDETNA
jgi:uncharacterized protein with HEPN domain